MGFETGMGSGGVPVDTSMSTSSSMPLPQNPQIQALMKILGPILAARQQAQQGGGGAPPQGTPGRVGGPPPAMTGGAMPPPVASPVRGGYEPPSFGAETMSKLDPSGAAAYNAVQGVQKLLENWNSRKDQKEHSEAANIAQNLMNAMQNNDVATVHEILNDKNSTKILNKVYKGWLTKAEEAKQPSEPDDPAVAGFEAGLKNYTQKKGAQPQGKGQPQGQGQSQPGQMPRSMGGYLLPQASPASQVGSQIQMNELQNALRSSQATSRLSDADLDKQARVQAGIEPDPKAQAELEKARLEQQAAIQKSQDELKKSALEVQKAQLAVQEEKLKAGAVSDAASYNLLIKKTELQTAQTKLALARIGPKAKQSPQVQARLQASTDALAVMDNLIAGKGDTANNTLTNLKKQLTIAGLKDMAGVITEGHLGTSIGATKPDDLKKIRQGLVDYQKALQVSGQTPDAPSGEDDSSPTSDGEDVITVSPDDVK